MTLVCFKAHQLVWPWFLEHIVYIWFEPVKAVFQKFHPKLDSPGSYRRCLVVYSEVQELDIEFISDFFLFINLLSLFYLCFKTNSNQARSKFESQILLKNIFFFLLLRNLCIFLCFDQTKYSLLFVTVIALLRAARSLNPTICTILSLFAPFYSIEIINSSFWNDIYWQIYRFILFHLPYRILLRSTISNSRIVLSALKKLKTVFRSKWYGPFLDFCNKPLIML